MKKYYWGLVKKDKSNELVREYNLPIICTTRKIARQVKQSGEKVVKITWNIINEK